ncbi:keywimysin-related RiPP [Streptomyces sp. P1-3]
MRTYERPTLTAVGSFTKVTGLWFFKRRGRRDFFALHRLFS